MSGSALDPESASRRPDVAGDGRLSDRAIRVVVATAIALGMVAAAHVTPSAGVAIAASGVAVGVAVPRLANQGSRFRARLSRTRALGSASSLVGRAALSMRIEPTVERAAAFAAATGDDPLARSLGSHVRRATGTSRHAFDGFVAEWSDRFPALERAVAHLEAAAAAPDADRDQHLDRAVDAALEGVQESLATFADDVRGPVTGLYAFGVLLPLALVGVLPAARATGVRISLTVVVLLYDVALPLVIGGASAWLLVRRPVAFPPPRVGRDHPDTPNTSAPSIVVAVAVGAASAVAAARVVDTWAAPVAAVGLGLGTGLVVRYRAARGVQKRVQSVEDDVHDALYLVGQRVAAGEAVETALEAVGSRLRAPTGDVLADAVGRQRRLGIGVRASFRGDHGALASLPSRRVREMADMFSLAATEGRPAGDALIDTAEHVETLRRIEREARRDLARVTDTLANTATVFGPLVGGATVALSARVGRTGSATAFGAGALPTAELGIAVGAYVLWLAVALTLLTTGLTRGLDRTLAGYRIGIALCLSTLCYLAAYVCAGLFL